MLQIHLLGGLQLARDGQPQRLQGLPKTKPLLVYLLLKRTAPVARDEIAAALWPDVNEATGRGNLRRHLHEFKRILPATADDLPWFVVDGGTVQWNPAAPMWLDVAAFEKAAADPVTWPKAVELYAGDLTPSLYDDWLFFPREQLRSRFFSVLVQLIDRMQAAGDLPAAIAYAQTALRHDPMREDVVRQLMTLRFANGDRAGALQEYHRFEQQLRIELEVAPMVETSALYDSIARHKAAAAPGERTAPPLATPPTALPTAPPAVPLEIGAATAAPTSAVTAARPGPCNLPAQLTSFIGRTTELAAMRTLLTSSTSSVRLLTLTGPGGNGKSRLALEAGSRIRTEQPDAFPGGILFVPLSNLNHDTLVLPTLAEIAGVRDVTGRHLLASMKEYLRPRQMLLIIDNFEHVQPAAPLLRELLEAAPALRILVTSRTVLRVYGEQEFPLAQLPLPTPDEQFESLAHRASVALFTTRSRAVRPTFALTTENAAAVAEICHRLDGLPLAIELAAARSKLLSPAALLERLRTGLALLSDPNLSPRHRTLQATLAWSYALLGPAEQQLFAQLSVFRGTFDLMAAAAVSMGSADVLDGVETLLDNSLLQQIDADIALLGEGSGPLGEEVRFRMLSVVRHYAAEHLQAQPIQSTIRRRLAAFCLELAQQAETNLRNAKQVYWLRRLEIELPNIRAALRWCLDSDLQADQETGLRLAAALTLFWYGAGHFVEAERWLQEALARLPAVAPADQAKALCALGIMKHAQGDLLGAPAYFAESLALYRRLDDPDGIAICLYGLGRLAIRQQDFARARRLLDESLTVHGAAGQPYHIPYALNMLAALAIAERNYDEAHVRYEAALAAARQERNLSLIAFILTGYGELARLLGDYTLAYQHYREAMTLAEELHQKPRRVMLLHNLAYVVLHNGAPRQACQLFQQCLALGMELPDRENFGMCLLGLGSVAAVKGDALRAAQLFGAGEQVLASIGATLAPADQAEYDRYRALVADCPDPATFAHNLAAGRQLPTDAMEALTRG